MTSNMDNIYEYDHNPSSDDETETAVSDDSSTKSKKKKVSHYKSVP